MHRRVRDYMMLLVGALVYGVLGTLFDQLTVTISPEYFLAGKALPADGLRLEAAKLGFRSGLPLGAATVGVGLLLRPTGSSSVRGVVRTCAIVLATTLLCVGIVPIVLVSLGAEWTDPAGGRLDGRFLTAWGMHIGAYAGTGFGLIAVVALARISRAAREAEQG